MIIDDVRGQETDSRTVEFDLTRFNKRRSFIIIFSR